jgi:hypothetical protein
LAQKKAAPQQTLQAGFFNDSLAFMNQICRTWRQEIRRLALYFTQVAGKVLVLARR